jgi:hypothetical protein
MSTALFRSSAAAVRSSAGRAVRAYGKLSRRRTLQAMERALAAGAGSVPGGIDVRRVSDTCVRADVSVDPVQCGFEVRLAPAGPELSVIGDGALSARVLRTVLVGLAPMVRGKQERHVLLHSAAGKPRDVARESVAKMLWLVDLLRSVPHEGAPTRRIPDTHVLTYWWDVKPNFGDTVGPWLVQHLTGQPVVNSRWVSPQRPSLFTVGSVVGHLGFAGHQLWGSGVIEPLGENKVAQIRPNKPAAIHAVRGALSRRELMQKLDWEVPEVYGDPALLLPRYLTPGGFAKAAGKVAVVPHYSHRKHFAGVRSPGLRLVDARDGLERVVTQIANASHCVSTSLHGVIVAQAYGVPWTWLRIGDHTLRGDAFKFEDFFTVLDREAVSERSVAAADISNVDYVKLGRTSRLPRTVADLNALHDAFPVDGPWRTPGGA